MRYCFIFFTQMLIITNFFEKQTFFLQVNDRSSSYYLLYIYFKLFEIITSTTSLFQKYNITNDHCNSEEPTFKNVTPKFPA